MTRFNVTYEVWDEAATEAGDTDEQGFECTAVGLREAVEAVTATRTNKVDGATVEASCSDIAQARWITVYNGMEFETGAYEQRSLHIPDGVTGASRLRIARLLGART